jgi:hypothetical protein
MYVHVCLCAGADLVKCMRLGQTAADGGNSCGASGVLLLQTIYDMVLCVHMIVC